QGLLLIPAFTLREKDGLEQMALLASYPGLMPELDSQGATEYNVDLVLAAIQQAIAERAAAQPPPADQ
ncbi:MAG: hypothetical protein MI924_14235, partial [Chloroflexales bacterium]|nr:hypothetical protein [Chloroflexales bacterium]